jgi:hypothetical protein
MKILAIDPGTTMSAWCLYDGERVVQGKIEGNDIVLAKLRDGLGSCADSLAIEMVASYGMPVGKEVFETVVWIGRFIEAASLNGKEFEKIYRKDVKMHLCQSMKAKDGNIRQAILDRFPRTGGGSTPQIGIAKCPGPLYGVSSHVWAALAVAIFRYDTLAKAAAV